MGVGAWGLVNIENSFMPSLGKSGVPVQNPTPKMIYLIGERTAVPICANPRSTAALHWDFREITAHLLCPSKASVFQPLMRNRLQ
jgi:hypothetical protein